jgi:hypothetical protein
MQACSNGISDSEIERVEAHIEQFVHLVRKALAEYGNSASINKHITKKTVRFVRLNEYRAILLNPEAGSYLYNAFSDETYNREQDRKLVSNTFVGPCGAFQVFAARDDFNALGIKFARDPLYLSCEYDKSGPENQFVFFVGVPLHVCSSCLQDLKKSYKCSRCRAFGVHARYCSRVCQVKHWPTHKVACGDALHKATMKGDNSLEAVLSSSPSLAFSLA